MIQLRNAGRHSHGRRNLLRLCTGSESSAAVAAVLARQRGALFQVASQEERLKVVQRCSVPSPLTGSFGSWPLAAQYRCSSSGSSTSSGTSSSSGSGRSGGGSTSADTGGSKVDSSVVARKSQLSVAKEQWRVLIQKLATNSEKAVRKAIRIVTKMGAAVLRDPRVVMEWGSDIYLATKHFLSWLSTGFRLFRRNISTSFHLLKRVAKGYRLSIRERRLLVRTTADCLKLIPFSFFIIVPFAELALPFVLRFFPNLLPSTFFEENYDQATLARKYKAKQQMAEFWQQVVAQRTEEMMQEDSPDKSKKAAKLREFEDRLINGAAFPSIIEIMRFARLFEQEFQLSKFSPSMLKAMCQMLGLRHSSWTTQTQMVLRHHINGLRTEDRDYLWEGVDQLSSKELIEACKKRAIRFHGVSEDEMRRSLARWLELSANRKIPTSLLLWIQTFYLSGREQAEVGSSLTDTSDLHPPEPEVEPEVADTVDEATEAMHSMVARQKASLEAARIKLEKLESEIVQVIEQPVAGSSASATPTDAEAISGETSRIEDNVSEDSALAVEQRMKQRILQRVRELDGALKLHKNIVERQRRLLSNQLEFMSHMRDNTPTHYGSQDAGRILLDQRIRLVEMMTSFAEDTAEIEALLEEADKGAGPMELEPDDAQSGRRKKEDN